LSLILYSFSVLIIPYYPTSRTMSTQKDNFFYLLHQRVLELLQLK
jgi:hypothetical protein